MPNSWRQRRRGGGDAGPVSSTKRGANGGSTAESTPDSSATVTQKLSSTNTKRRNKRWIPLDLYAIEEEPSTPPAISSSPDNGSTLASEEPSASPPLVHPLTSELSSSPSPPTPSLESSLSEGILETSSHTASSSPQISEPSTHRSDGPAPPTATEPFSTTIQAKDHASGPDQASTRAASNAAHLLTPAAPPLPEFLVATAAQVSRSVSVATSIQEPGQASLKTPSTVTLNELSSSSLAHLHDSDATKDKLRVIMSRFDDAFDIEEWTQNEEQAGIDDSPEQLTITPQPVTYTTVGSLKPIANPHFTPPNRIQRDGALRRAPPAPVQTRGHDGYLCGRGPIQQHNVGHGSSSQSQYGTSSQSQYGSSSQSQYGSTAQPEYGSTPNPQRLSGLSSNLTEAEKEILKKLGFADSLMGSSEPSMRSGNLPPNSRGEMLRTDASLNPKAEVFNIHDRQIDDRGCQSNSINNSLAKIDKMQTLLAMSQYPNPMQQLAKDRLSGFAAVKAHNSVKSTGSSVTQQQAPLATLSYRQNLGGLSMQGGADCEKQEMSDFDHKFRFPPPGLPRPPQANTSIASYGQQTFSGFNHPNEQIFTNQEHHMRSGRPQPLTAGPPGQRQNVSFAAQGMSSLHGMQPGSSQTSYGQVPFVLPPNSPWMPQSRGSMFTSVPTEHSKIRNTLPLSECAKYYPNGFPPDMLGDYTRLPPAEHQKNVGVICRPTMANEEIKRKEQDKWWYSGVRKFNKTIEESLDELERREYERNHGPNPQPIPSPPPISESETLTIKDIQLMSEPDVAAPILIAGFGTLLGYADRVVTPTNKSIMSKFVPAPAWCIDNSEKGNQSFFGEDWGPRPKRLGRDPRYQPFD